MKICVQQMRRSGNKEENKRIIMDMDVVLKSHNCPYIVQCIGIYITSVSTFLSVLPIALKFSCRVMCGSAWS
jgi:mitogen-activated protein kinase kinase 7